LLPALDYGEDLFSPKVESLAEIDQQTPLTEKSQLSVDEVMTVSYADETFVVQKTKDEQTFAVSNWLQDDLTQIALTFGDVAWCGLDGEYRYDTDFDGVREIALKYVKWNHLTDLNFDKLDIILTFVGSV